MIESQCEFTQIARLVTLLVCLFATSSACGAGQASADLFETRLAEGIKLLGEGRVLESVKVRNSAKQSAPQDARAYFYCGAALAEAGQMRAAAAAAGGGADVAPR